MEEYKNQLLLSEAKYIIYGTGKLAELFYSHLKDDKERSRVLYFMETIKTKNSFLGKPIISSDELDSVDVNRYRFIISSESYGEEMLRTLLSKGVNANSVTFVGEYLNKKESGEPFSEKLNIFLDITDGCNLNCIFCSRDNYEITYMKPEDFENILKKLDSKANSFQLSCAWEYSIAKNSAEIIEILGKYDVGKTTIYTNGNILTEQMANTMINAKLDNLVFSIGEAAKETYERVRAGGRFERVTNNIRRVKDLKIKYASSLPNLCVNMTLIKSNIEELIDFVDLAHELGIEEIRGRHLILNEGLDMDNEVIDNLERANEIINHARIKANGFGMKFNIPLYAEEINKKHCKAPWTQLYVSSNGDASICPRIHLYDIIGNIIKDDLKTIINGKEIANIRNMFETGRFDNPVCEICINGLETRKYINQGF